MLLQLRNALHDSRVLHQWKQLGFHFVATLSMHELQETQMSTKKNRNTCIWKLFSIKRKVARAEIWVFPGRLADGERAYHCFSKATFINTICFDDETMFERKVSYEPRDSYWQYRGTYHRAKATVMKSLSTAPYSATTYACKGFHTTDNRLSKSPVSNNSYQALQRTQFYR